MITFFGLLVLVLAAIVAVVGVLTNAGSGHAVGSDFGIFGMHLVRASTGQLFFGGILVGIIGMLGLIMLFSAITRRISSRSSRRELKETRRETEALKEERDQIASQLKVERGRREAAEAKVTQATQDTQETAPNAT
ncbi:MAG TPA: hypothetical protein VMV52_02565 [Candidatus Nanopelagicaceae bacterium]|nr:hypothetical protein [Candidatus Nanopelagicaceae bacterium]